MDPNATVRELRAAIAALEPDAPIARAGKWFETQHEHWLGRLDDYAGPGANGRTTPSPTDARTVYNRIVDADMLIFLADAAGASPRRHHGKPVTCDTCEALTSRRRAGSILRS